MNSPSEDSAAPPPPEEGQMSAIPVEGIAGMRPRLPLWKRIGGDGLIVSVVFHGILLFIFAAWVIVTITDEAKTDPETFATGSGGGAKGERAKVYEHKMTPRNAQNLARTSARITSKSATASVALPDLPTTAAPSLMAGLSGGGSSKGFGGGSGGGIGSGKGVGVGNSRNFVGVFGSKLGTVGLVGTFYDFKQTRTGRPTDMMGGAPETFGHPSNSAAIGLYVNRVRDFLDREMSTSSLSNVFRAPDNLIASQIFIPPRSANSAPEAYGVAEQVRPSRWIAHYKGDVQAPQGGKFRFVGSGDDILVVRWDKKYALDSGYGQYVVGMDNIYPDFGKRKYGEVHPARLGRPMQAGPWLTVTKGKKYPLEIMIGETPGGTFYAIICIEVQGPDGKGTGLKLLRFSNAELPAEIAKGDPRIPNVDMQAEGWIFEAVRAGAAR